MSSSNRSRQLTLTYILLPYSHSLYFSDTTTNVDICLLTDEGTCYRATNRSHNTIYPINRNSKVSEINERK
jgi:hypothetical protein